MYLKICVQVKNVDDVFTWDSSDMPKLNSPFRCHFGNITVKSSKFPPDLRGDSNRIGYEHDLPTKTVENLDWTWWVGKSMCTYSRLREVDECGS